MRRVEFSQRRRIFAGAIAAAALASVYGLSVTRVNDRGLPAVSPNSGTAVSSKQRTPLRSSSRTIDLGVVAQGDRHAEAFSLTNCGDLPVAIRRVRTSCDCVSLRLDRSELNPGETVFGRASLDLRPPLDSRDFADGLEVEVSAFDDSNAELFSVVVQAQVVPAGALTATIFEDRGPALAAAEPEATR